jgi:hypothetical protein
MNERIEQACRKIRAALATATNPAVRDALLASLEILESQVETADTQPAVGYAGSVDFTFEDEQYLPYGREVDVRIFYCWHDYDPADEPSPVWGASIEDIQVLAVRHFDRDGHEVTAREHELDLAWSMLNRQYEAVTEACTEDGYRHGVGEAPVTYSPPTTAASPDSPANTTYANRMAGSVATRGAAQQRRHLG